jgi:hypothetical protein
MKKAKLVVCGILAAAFLAAPLTGFSAEEKKPAKPYPLKTCVVSDEKLDAMGSPHVFTYKDQEIKLCCKGCLKDFNKDPEKYLKKIAEAEKKAK